jgi:ferric-dicitrate binding protein FerR (iron transport regulator)
MMDEQEETTARLLQIAGPRPAVPADSAERVRGAVYRHWVEERRRRALRRRVAASIGALATAAAIAIAVWGLRPATPLMLAPAEIVATVEQIDGEAPIRAGEAVHAGAWIDSGPATRARLLLNDGTSMRLDTSSRARLLSPAVIELAAGAIYLDTGTDSNGLEIRTPFGTVHDVGTQFEVRLAQSSLRLRVRTGLVELRHDGRSISARPGMEVTIAAGEAITRTFPAHGPEWQWAARLAPVFHTDGRPLADFLEHLSREQGWTVRYADGGLARDASGIILHGSVNGLQPDEALAVALRTSGLTHQLHDGELLISRAMDRE